MNRRQWKELCKVDHKAAFTWYNKTHKILMSKEFESDERTDKNAKVIHHLQDTEEQRKYNDEHYGMFGFEIDEDGNEVFNYGKYVVFWTKEHHNDYHHSSAETARRISINGKGKHNVTDETREKLSLIMRNRVKDPEYIKKLSDAAKASWENNDERRALYRENYSGVNSPSFGKKASDETRKKLSESHIGQVPWNKGIKTPDGVKDKIRATWTEERRASFSKMRSGENNPMHNRILTDDEKERRRLSVKEAYKEISNAYKEHKENGGQLGWQEFKKYFSKIKNDGK